MSNHFDTYYGWREIRNTTALTAGAPTTLVAAPGQNFAILVRRIRGSSNGDLRLFSASSQIGSTIKAGDYLDVPGLQLFCNENEALRADVASGSGVANDISVQFAIVRVRDSRVAV